MELQPTAEVICTRAGDDITFEWRGGEILWVFRGFIEQADERYIRQRGRFLTIGPYRLRLIYEDRVRWVLVYHLDSPRAAFMVGWYQFLMGLERLNWSVLRGLARWGVIRCEEGEILSWKRFVLVEVVRGWLSALGRP